MCVGALAWGGSLDREKHFLLRLIHISICVLARGRVQARMKHIQISMINPDYKPEDDLNAKRFNEFIRN